MRDVGNIVVVVAALYAVGCATGLATLEPGPGDDTNSPDASASVDPPKTPDRGDVPDANASASDDAGGAVDAASAVTSDAGAGDSASADSATACKKTLSITEVKISNSVCTDINTKVTKAPADLTYPCGGGAASANFDGQAFTGTVTGTAVLLTNVSDFTLGSCHLESTQTISGNLDAAPLAFGYTERFLSGDCSQDIICTASAKVAVE